MHRVVVCPEDAADSPARPTITPSVPLKYAKLGLPPVSCDRGPVVTTRPKEVTAQSEMNCGRLEHRP